MQNECRRWHSLPQVRRKRDELRRLKRHGLGMRADDEDEIELEALEYKPTTAEAGT